MKIAILTDSREGLCGVADHANRLASELSSRKHEVKTTAEPRLLTGASTVQHIHYPIDYLRTDLRRTVQLMAVSSPLVVSIHEWSRVHPLRRTLIQRLVSRADRVIFPSTEEAQAWLNTDNRTKVLKHKIIPLASNIPRYEFRAPAQDRLTFFGRLNDAPTGVIEFLQMHRGHQHMTPGIRWTICGSLSPDHHDRLAPVLAGACDQGVDVLKDLPSAEVARVLSESIAVILPQPYSDRSSATLAAICNGTPVICRPPRSAYLRSSPPEGVFTLDKDGLHGSNFVALTHDLRRCGRLRNELQRFYDAHFSWSILTSDVETTYREAQKAAGVPTVD